MEGELKEVLKSEYADLEKLCAALWHDAYDELLGKAQVDYMLEKFQSAKAFERQVSEENYSYYFIVAAGERAGYCGLQMQKDALFLSKLYLAASFRGAGIAKTVLQKCAQIAKAAGKDKIFLTVNKENARAMRAYEKFGFVKTESVVTDIGGGYVMDDYVYEYYLKRGEGK